MTAVRGPRRTLRRHAAALPDPHLRVPDERARFRADRRRAHGRRHDADRRRRRRRVIVLNTCAIRENADNKLYGNLGHLKPLKDADPSLRIVVAGCLAQKDQGVIQRKAPVGRRRRRHARPPAAARPVGALARRGPADGRARVHRDLPERAARRPRRRVPGMGLDRAGLRQRLHLLHRAARPWPAAVALDRGHPGRGAGPRRRRVSSR